MTRTLSIALLAGLFIAGGSWFLTRPAGGPESLDIGAAFAQETDAEIDTSSVADMVKGDPEAPVTVIEYASFTCPHCATFHEEVLPVLQSEYIDTGKVQMIYREVYFDLPGLWASMVARCGGEMRYFGIVDMLYERQRQWTQGEGAQIAENLRQIGLSAGMTQDQIDACFTDAAKAQTLMAWYEENAEADGIRSTPSFVIDGELFEGNWSNGLLDAVAAAVGE